LSAPNGAFAARGQRSHSVPLSGNPEDHRHAVRDLAVASVRDLPLLFKGVAPILSKTQVG